MVQKCLANLLAPEKNGFYKRKPQVDGRQNQHVIVQSFMIFPTVVSRDSDFETTYFWK